MVIIFVLLIILFTAVWLTWKRRREERERDRRIQKFIDRYCSSCGERLPK